MDTEPYVDGDRLSDHLRNIVGGVATLVALCVPLLLIHTLRKRIEEGEAFKTLERKLG